MSTRHGGKYKANNHRSKHDQVPPNLADVTTMEVLDMPPWLRTLCERRISFKNFRLSCEAAKLLQRGLAVESVSIQTCLSTTWIEEVKAAMPATSVAA